MIEQLDFSPSLKSLREALKQGCSIVVEELWDVTKAALAILAVRATQKSILVITGGMREDSLFDNIFQWAPDLAVEFPAWETLPGEEILPSPDIIGKRMEALHTLLHKKGPSIVLCPIASFLQKIPAKERMRDLFSTWQKGTKLPFDQIPKLLT